MVSIPLVGIETWQIKNVHLRVGHVETTVNGLHVAIWSRALMRSILDSWEEQDKLARKLTNEQEVPRGILVERIEKACCAIILGWLNANQDYLEVDLAAKDSPHDLNIFFDREKKRVETKVGDAA